nr:MAG TPA: hypothetical protein [Caudoviricetes sp.]
MERRSFERGSFFCVVIGAQALIFFVLHVVLKTR